MADTFALNGSWTTEPRSTGQQSCDPALSSEIDESVALETKEIGTYKLTVGTAVPVALGAIAALVGASVLIIRTVGGKVKATITTTDGATQAVPVDPLLILISTSVPVTALTLTRDPAVTATVTVKVFLGQPA